MNKPTVDSLIEIARIHESHLLYSLNNLSDIFPITEEKVVNLTRQEFLLLELLTTRFSKLQDFIGSNLTDAVLIKLNEFSDNLSMIDKMNKLEKLELIKDAHLWQDIRKLRNHLTHEYPDKPKLVAQFLNEAYSLSFELLEILNNLLKRLESLKPTCNQRGYKNGSCHPGLDPGSKEILNDPGSSPGLKVQDDTLFLNTPFDCKLV